ncbi:globin [Brevibacillus choshinensis]|uniref:Globin n=1 Tax=Brevibacillus choshinensis TaxID=54911 RepID=A0ABR5N9J9_BRECH|nr:globin [Brevibacillus choshinensis]KQL47114.1 globin [Brevibacillus choshinensis]MED4586249.1 globin [Brevibacillus choshinensis]MED4782924.1 globin [Brevibacillus choshinensis]
MSNDNRTPYEMIGGADTLARLVDIFYDHVKQHPDISPLFPDDFTEVKERQYQFLTQFLGGPTLYSDLHGHPMLRARHMRFPIGTVQAEAWLSCMKKAMDETGLEDNIRQQIFDRLRLTAHHMVNQWEQKEEA